MIVHGIGVEVSSDDPRASQVFAEAVAKVMSQHWLEGAAEDEPLTVMERRQDGEVAYTVRRLPSILPS